MSVEKLTIPADYHAALGIRETEIAIKLIKDTFERELAKQLNLTRVSAPLFVRPESGLNDDLNGVERPVRFDVKDSGQVVEIVQSLAKWKRLALKAYGFHEGEGLYADMNAIRRDEDLDNLHSVYVDQWDWERVITKEERTLAFLEETVKKIYQALKDTETAVLEAFPSVQRYIPEELCFMTAQELEDRYPSLSPKEREDAVAKEFGAVFIMQIGGALRSGIPHDGRAPDYDDWALNGDLLIYYPILGQAVELSSMGIRVDEEAMARQLKIANAEERKERRFHKALLNGEYPLTIGGGLGQSRICMLMLGKAHIGEVQSSTWGGAIRKACKEAGIFLL
ncbi:MAG: aspartate--ammonia ligase [Christensenellaceae bacterium]|jgi:aspartate--ammonia ligase